MTKLIPERIVIYPKDVQNITGKKERTARKYLSDIRQSLGKKQTDLISVEEFCIYSGLKLEQVKEFLKY